MIKKKFYTKRCSRDISITSPDKYRISIICNLVGRGKKILDIGCYNGIIGSLVAKNDNEVGPGELFFVLRSWAPMLIPGSGRLTTAHSRCAAY